MANILSMKFLHWPRRTTFWTSKSNEETTWAGNLNTKSNKEQANNNRVQTSRHKGNQGLKKTSINTQTNHTQQESMGNKWAHKTFCQLYQSIVTSLHLYELSIFHINDLWANGLIESPCSLRKGVDTQASFKLGYFIIYDGNALFPRHWLPSFVW